MAVDSASAVGRDRLEAAIGEVGRAIDAAHPARSRSPLKAIDERAMQFAAHDRELRAALFRFVDVTPACRSVDDLARHLSGFLDEVQDRPRTLDAALRMMRSRTGRAALGTAAAAGVRHMAHRFIVGATPRDALPVLSELWRRGLGASVDLLGEATVTAAEADRYAARCDDALMELAGFYARQPEGRAQELDSTGALARANLSVKVSALTPLMRPEAPELGRDDAAGRLRPLLRRARDAGAHLHVDMESLDALETTMELVFELLDEEEFRDGPSAGIVLQAYLRESPGQLERILDWARSTARRPPLVVRLVKGAYWDHEIVEARQHGWSPPVFEVKADCDRNFEELTRRLLDAARSEAGAAPPVRVAIASHNLRSVAHAVAYNRLAGGDDRDLELQVLRGLGDDLGRALAELGFRVRVYCPVGDLVAGMAYLVRRLLENTANESFLSAQASGTPIEELLRAP